MSELKPCPFCGNKPEAVKSATGKILYIKCLYCLINKRIDSWNTRHYPPEVEKAVERMKPKKTYKDTDSGGTDHERCSSCNASICLWDERRDYHDEFCWKCGQRLIRSE